MPADEFQETLGRYNLRFTHHSKSDVFILERRFFRKKFIRKSTKH
ncbi:hypothetical protein CHCC5027_3620 [Bacillus paralicheniformis]|nr:hypothetical protein CHCC5027_3620 [Bacillus paralicheniformis]